MNIGVSGRRGRAGRVPGRNTGPGAGAQVNVGAQKFSAGPERPRPRRVNNIGPGAGAQIHTNPRRSRQPSPVIDYPDEYDYYDYNIGPGAGSTVEVGEVPVRPARRVRPHAQRRHRRYPPRPRRVNIGPGAGATVTVGAVKFSVPANPSDKVNCDYTLEIIDNVT